MRFLCDPTGFPLLALPEIGASVQLLPVTKVQFERFIAEPNEFGDGWYETTLGLNPRVSYRDFTAGNREGLFLTGTLPSEALAFAAWMGKGFDLPTIQEWRAVYKALADKPIELAGQSMAEICEPARLILKRLFNDLPTRAIEQRRGRFGGRRQIQFRSLLDLSLMGGGVVEWVRDGDDFVGLGSPRSTFHRNAWHPLSNEVIPHRPVERQHYFGFRLVRRV